MEGRAAPAVQSEGGQISRTVYYRYNEHNKHEPALILTARQDPSSGDYQDRENGYTDKIGNINRLHVDGSFHGESIL